MPEVRLTQDPDADRLLSDNPLALLIGMLLDQQVPMEWAFAAPRQLQERLGGTLDASTIAAMSPEAVEEIFRAKPALHRYPGSMAKRVHALCTQLVEHHGGDAEDVWTGVEDGAALRRRLESLPGFGAQKARIFLALLGKQYGVTSPGWRQAAGDYGLEGYRSIADVVDADSLARVRETKQAAKRKAAAG